MTVGRIPSVEGGIQPTILDAKGDLIVATGNDSPNRLAVGANKTRLVADSVQTTGLKYVADTTNYAIAAKGDILAGTAAETLAALTVGANDTVLTADSTAATGLKWSAPASGGMTLLSTTTLTGASVTVSSINQTYINLIIVVNNATLSAANLLRIQANGSTTLSNTGFANLTGQSFSSSGNGTLYDTGSTNIFAVVNFQNYTNASYSKQGNYVLSTSTPTIGAIGGYLYSSNTAISSFTFSPNSGTFTGGQVLIYGVK